MTTTSLSRKQRRYHNKKRTPFLVHCVQKQFSLSAVFIVKWLSVMQFCWLSVTTVCFLLAWVWWTQSNQKKIMTNSPVLTPWEKKRDSSTFTDPFHTLTVIDQLQKKNVIGKHWIMLASGCLFLAGPTVVRTWSDVQRALTWKEDMWAHTGGYSAVVHSTWPTDTMIV